MRVTLALLVLVLAVPASAQRSGRPAAAAPPELQHGTFDIERFESKALGQRVPYGIYLPSSYGEEGNEDRRYPLLVWLHGMFEDHRRFHVRGGTAILDRMIGEGTMPEVILVTAEGSRNSFYTNGVKSGAWEDCITRDLMAHLEATYRIAAERSKRVLMGVSMGGYGALKLALRHPDTFGVVAAHSAAIMPRDPAELDDRFPWLKRWGGGQRALGAIFGEPFDRQRWDAENLLLIVERIEPKRLHGLKIYLDCGDRDRYGFDAPNRELHELLAKKGIEHTWRLVAGGDHGWRSGYNAKALPHSLAFVAAALTAARGTAGLKGLLGPGRDSGR